MCISRRAVDNRLDAGLSHAGSFVVLSRSLVAFASHLAFASAKRYASFYNRRRYGRPWQYTLKKSPNFWIECPNNPIFGLCLQNTLSSLEFWNNNFYFVDFQITRRLRIKNEVSFTVLIFEHTVKLTPFLTRSKIELLCTVRYLFKLFSNSKYLIGN